MLKFTTIVPIDGEMCNSALCPLITPSKDCRLMGGKIQGKNATIVGRALELAGFGLPCFFDGDIEDLDKEDAKILMVIPSGTYNIKVSKNAENEYLLDLAD